MAAGNFIIRNVAAPAASVEIADLGITLAIGTDRDLHDFEFHEIAVSYGGGDLGAAITALDIVLLDSDGATALTTLQTQALFDKFFDVSLARTLRTITGDTGTFTVDEPNDTLSLTGAGGLTVDISGGTITLDASAVALNDPGANGIVVRTAPNTTTARSLVAPTEGITITNPDGVAGNPTFVLANDLAALEGLGSTGFAVRSAADTWVQRTIVASTTAGRQGSHVNNGTGVAGNPEIGVDINNLTSSVVNLAATDELIVFNGTNNLSYTGQQIADGVVALISIGNAYTTITGDTGSATASTSTDTLNFTGVGITTSVANGAPDAVTLTLNIADLAAGVGPLIVSDEIAVNDGGTTLRFTFTDVVEDLDIPFGITANGIIVRTAADTYTSRTIVKSTAAAFEGANVVNGDGVAGNPTVGVDINNLTSSVVNLGATNELIVYNGTNNLSYTGQQIADGVSTLLGGVATLSFVTIATPTGGPVVADTSADTLTLTQSTGIAITGTAISDTINFAPANDLAAVEALATTGLATRTGVETWVTRTLTAPAAGITITNPAGIAGDPTFVLANDLAALEGLAGTGIAVRSAADTWVQRSIVASVDEDNLGASVVNGSGVAGNPTIGVTIVTLTDPGADMAAADEFIVHDKSEGTGGANRKMTGQNIADGVQTILGGPFATLSFVTFTTPTGGPVVADTTADTLTLTQSTGISITGTAGTDTINFAPANDLAAVEALATTGLAVRTGVETWATRTLVAPAAGITITNPAGIAGDPTFALANDLGAIEALNTNGILTRTAADTWAARTITGTANQITSTNGDGIAGNPTLSVPTTFIAPGSVQVTTTLYQSQSTAVAAAGATQGTATALTSYYNIVTTVAAATGVIFPTPVSPFGQEIFVTNRGANALNVYPNSGAAIGSGAANAPVVLPVGQEATFVAISATQWHTKEPILLAGTNITLTPGPGTLTIAATAGATAPGGVNTNVQFNNVGVFGGNSAFNFITGANPRVDILGTTQTNQLRVGGSTDVGTPAVYFEAGTAGASIAVPIEVFRTYLNGGSPSGSAYISFAYDSNSPLLRMVDVDDDPPFISFETIGGGTYAAPAIINKFGGRGPVAGATTGFAWYVNAGQTLAHDTNFLALGTALVTSTFGGYAQASGNFATAGDAQTRVVVLRTATTTAAVTEAFLDGTGGTARMVLPDDTTWAFRILVSARRTDANNESAVFQFVGGIDRNVGVATTAIVGAVSKTVVAEDTAAWDCTVNADTTNGSLRIQVTGEAAKTIRWVARVELVEVTG